MSLAMKQSKYRAGHSMTSGAMISRRAYMGDPGLFGFLGKAVGTLAGAVGSVLPGPIGLAAKGVSTLLSGGGPGGAAGSPSTSTVAFTGGWGGGVGARPISTSLIPQQAPPVPQVPVPGVQGSLQRLLPGGATGYQPAGPAPSGYHWNKSDYFLKDGTFVPAGTKLVKNRRRNPLNPRAASRAISRLESAKKATRRLDRVAIKCRRCGYASCRCK